MHSKIIKLFITWKQRFPGNELYYTILIIFLSPDHDLIHCLYITITQGNIVAQGNISCYSARNGVKDILTRYV